MKKKVLYLSILILLILSTTGCLKFNTTMKINKDKSFDFSIIIAIDKTYIGDKDVFNEEKKKEIREKGFNVTDYQEKNMVGININKKIRNIDLVSSTNNENFNLSKILASQSNETLIFKVKKGIFKNRYIANIKLDNLNDSNLASNKKNEEINFNNVIGTEDDNKDDLDSDFLQSAITNIDLSFKVILPYPAKTHNAISASNNNKELSWNLATDNQKTIQFEFELYNRKNIYIILSIIIILIIILTGNNKKFNPKIITQEKVINPIIENTNQDTVIEEENDI